MGRGRGAPKVKVATGSTSERKNGKAPKKNPKTNRRTGRTVNGYKPERLAAKENSRLDFSSPILQPTKKQEAKKP